jgi:hypothetical protein
MMEKNMGKKLFRTAGLLVLAAVVSVFSLVPGTVSAEARAVARYYGAVTLDGNNVPAGTTVTGWIVGANGGPWTVNSFVWTDAFTSYALDIPADNPNTLEKEGGASGDVIHFKITTPQGEILGPTSVWPGIKDVKFPLRIITSMPGDANGDGVINIGDVTKVQRIILGLDPPTIGADANLDGVIDMGDVTKIMLIILGL